MATLAVSRSSLFAIELRAEARRGAEALALAAAAMAFLHGALLLAAAAVVIAFWDTHRLAATAIMALLYAIVAAASLIGLRSRLAGLQDAFPVTRDQLRQDLLCSMQRGARALAWARRGLVVANLAIAVAGFFGARVRNRTDAAGRKPHARPSTGEIK